jgi:hypothetical protein
MGEQIQQGQPPSRTKSFHFNDLVFLADCPLVAHLLRYGMLI